jgi:hypothetical protein
MSEMNQPEGGLQRQYEFDEQENSVFRDLAGVMKFCGTMMLIAGPLLVISGITSLMHKEFGGAIGQIGTGVGLFLMGNWTGDASKTIAKIVDTEGNDITHLISAMIDLRKTFTMQQKLLIGVVILVIGGLAFGILSSSTH